MVSSKRGGYCIKYKPEEHSHEVNEFLKVLEEKFSLNLEKILFHDKKKNDIKTGEPNKTFNHVDGYSIENWVKKFCLITHFKFKEGRGSPNGNCRGSNGFVTENKKCNLLNEKKYYPSLLIESLDLSREVNHKEKYGDFKTKILNNVPSYKKKRVICFSQNKVENTRRPLKVVNGELKITKNDIKNISDMRIDFHDIHNKKSGVLFISKEYISQKSTNLVTFINLGVNNDNCFRESEMKKNKIVGEVGISILDTFYIDPNGFCEIFNNYGCDISESKLISEKYNKEIQFNDDNTPFKNEIRKKMESFLKQCLGNGNSIISHYINNKDKIYMSKNIKTKIESYKSFYGGKKSNSKRIDIEIVTETMIFTVNIRNKQGKIYPSHIMCDFKYHNDQMLS